MEGPPERIGAAGPFVVTLIAAAFVAVDNAAEVLKSEAGGPMERGSIDSYMAVR